MPLPRRRELVDLNLTSTFVCTKLVGEAMLARSQGGQIINIASINAFVAGRDIGGRHYEASKAMVCSSLVRSLPTERRTGSPSTRSVPACS